MCNDGVIIRNCSVTGHGGFMMVLDPDGQVLTKSPYCQTGSKKIKSNKKRKYYLNYILDLLDLIVIKKNRNDFK